MLVPIGWQSLKSWLFLKENIYFWTGWLLIKMKSVYNVKGKVVGVLYCLIASLTGENLMKT